MPNWIDDIPDILRAKLEAVIGFRSYGPAEIYAAVKEWLEAHDVDPPTALG